WVGYEYDNFRGRQYLWDMSDRGEYNSCDKWSGPVDHVSSVRAVRQDWDHIYFQLCPVVLVSVHLMTRFSMNRMDSVRVLGGAWVVYQEPNYRGTHYILEKRDYTNHSDWGAQGSTVGSIRRVRFN
ncbi:UNVERIFIED_CONTAM: hypothetical protein FKN15_049153, partial [Acipenser sinensis]